MIYIDRNRVPKPQILEKNAEKETERAREFFLKESARTGHERYYFKLSRHKEVRGALGALFYDKCAFCETRYGHVSPMDVEHFRPKQRCVDQKGQHFPLHYFWMAYEWRNLYASCPACNRAKRNRFPIKGERASLEKYNREADPEVLYELEKPLLLDPCRRDDFPEEHLIYTDEGIVTSDTDRGRTTIDLLDLNREALVESRSGKLAELNERIDAVRKIHAAVEKGDKGFDEADVEAGIEKIMKMTRDESEYAGMCRQFAKRFSDEFFAIPMSEAFEPAKAMLSEAPILEKARYVSMADQVKIAGEFKEFKAKQQAYSLEKGAEEDYYTTSRTIEKIVIRNFRPIEDLTIDIRSPEEIPWTMLLGENGCGKSSVLKATALALMGDDYRRQPHLQLDASSYVRYGCDSGSVEVTLSGMSEPIVMTFEKGKPHFEGGQAPKALLLAYGSTRLLPRRDEEAFGTKYARVDNLFDPFVPMKDARRWLLGLASEKFAELKPALKQLLNLNEKDDLVQNHAKDRVEAIIFGDPVPLEHLSDGYQAVVAVAAEIMSVLLDFWGDVASAEGIVLLDEVGSHLHPSWRMIIVESLRVTFPSVQFLVTTHNPLCLRGMKKDEVIVMQRDARGRVVTETELPNPEAMRVDQILQSEFFGLNSTVDRKVNKLYDDYYKLLSIRKLNDQQQLELDDIKKQLQEHRVFGENKRERMMLEAIDAYHAEKRRTASKGKKTVLKERTRKELREMWARIRADA